MFNKNTLFVIFTILFIVIFNSHVRGETDLIEITELDPTIIIDLKSIHDFIFRSA